MVGEFESLSVPSKTKGTAYETTANQLTEKSRTLLTGLSDSGGYRTSDGGVNSFA